jgi:hypothetical protein
MSARDIIAGIAFSLLNVLDAYLTRIALAIGAREGNPFLDIAFRTDMLLKGLVAVAIVAALAFWDRCKLLKWLNLVMLVVVLWNFAVILLQLKI